MRWLNRSWPWILLGLVAVFLATQTVHYRSDHAPTHHHGVQD